MGGQQIPISEIRDIHPLGYAFYEYFDAKQIEVNGKHIQPIWQHGVALPNLFFNRYHVEEIQFPKGRTLHHAKDPQWFNLVHNYIHTPDGVSFYTDLFWLEWQHRSNKPSTEANKLCSELFELKGGTGGLNLSIEDLW